MARVHRSRRQFVKEVTAAAVSTTLVGNTVNAGNAIDPMPKSVLGRTGAKVSRLGIGCAHFGRDHVSSDDVRRVLNRALELGVNYLDVAPNYGTAEEKMGPSIQDIRDQVFLVTKTEEPTYEGTWKLLRQSMKRLRTDHLDLVHLHNLGDGPGWPVMKFVFANEGAMGALREAKKHGVVRFIGASGHLFPSRFHEALDWGEIDVLMNAVNYVVQHTYDFEHKLWSRAAHQNLGLVAMKVLGGAGTDNRGFQLPADMYEQAIRYALSIPGLSCAVIGIENLEELERAAKTVAHAKPLTEEEFLNLSRTGLELAATPKWKTVYGGPLT